MQTVVQLPIGEYIVLPFERDRLPVLFEHFRREAPRWLPQWRWLIFGPGTTTLALLAESARQPTCEDLAALRCQLLFASPEVEATGRLLIAAREGFVEALGALVAADEGSWTWPMQILGRPCPPMGVLLDSCGDRLRSAKGAQRRRLEVVREKLERAVRIEGAARRRRRGEEPCPRELAVRLQPAGLVRWACSMDSSSRFRRSRRSDSSSPSARMRSVIRASSSFGRASGTVGLRLLVHDLTPEVRTLLQCTSGTSAHALSVYVISKTLEEGQRRASRRRFQGSSIEILGDSRGPVHKPRSGHLSPVDLLEDARAGLPCCSMVIEQQPCCSMVIEQQQHDENL